MISKHARIVRSALAVALTAVLTLLVAAPASAHQAAHAARGDYYQPPTPYRDSGTFDPECEGLELSVTFRVSGVDSVRNVPGSGGQAFLLKDTYRFHEVWTDTESGKVLFTWRGRYRFEEVSATRVPKSQVPRDLIPDEGLVGPVYRFKILEVGHDTIRSPKGKVLYRTAGLVVYSHLFDTLGDSQPGGTSLDFRTVKVVGPHPLLDVDICDVAAGLARRGQR
jgi:hypothetical protein